MSLWELENMVKKSLTETYNQRALALYETLSGAAPAPDLDEIDQGTSRLHILQEDIRRHNVPDTTKPIQNDDVRELYERAQELGLAVEYKVAKMDIEEVKLVDQAQQKVHADKGKRKPALAAKKPAPADPVDAVAPIAPAPAKAKPALKAKAAPAPVKAMLKPKAVPKPKAAPKPAGAYQFASELFQGIPDLDGVYYKGDLSKYNRAHVDAAVAAKWLANANGLVDMKKATVLLGSLTELDLQGGQADLRDKIQASGLAGLKPIDSMMILMNVVLVD